MMRLRFEIGHVGILPRRGLDAVQVDASGVGAAKTAAGRGVRGRKSGMSQPGDRKHCDRLPTGHVLRREASHAACALSAIRL